MLTSAVLLSTWWIVLASVAGGVLWSLAGPSVWDGIGGRMGAAAYIAASFIYAVADLTGAESHANALPVTLDGAPHWMVVPVGAASALITWLVVQRRGLPFVLVSGLLVVPVCGVLAIAGSGPSLALSASWFGGTMVGASAPSRLPSAWWVGLAGLIYGALMLHFAGPLTGHVGVIGATATIACLAVAAIEWVVLAPWFARLVRRVAPRRSGA